MSSVSQKLRAYCRERNLRCPVKKLMVADQLASHPDYVEAATIFLDLRNSRRKVCVSTVYQSLNWLIEIGFAEHDSNDAGPLRYRLTHSNR